MKKINIAKTKNLVSVLLGFSLHTYSFQERAARMVTPRMVTRDGVPSRGAIATPSLESLL